MVSMKIDVNDDIGGYNDVNIDDDDDNTTR